eukprot:SAG11_NODE_12076_length_723_cov_0.828526_1_plen_135_part_01
MTWHALVATVGWEFDRKIFDAAARPKMNAGPTSYKYPLMKPNFRSHNVENLFFAGTLSHGLDWRKSSGGFIHGFRYNARALARVLAVENHGVLICISTELDARSVERCLFCLAFDPRPSASCDVSADPPPPPPPP